MSRLTLEISQASGPILQVRLGRDQEALAGGVVVVVEAVGGGGDVCGGGGCPPYCRARRGLPGPGGLQ